MLYNPCPGNFAVGIVYGCVALKIGHIQKLVFEPDGAVFQSSVPVAEELVDGAGVDDLFGAGNKFVPVRKKVAAEAHFDRAEHICDQLCVATYGYALVTVVEIVVIERKPDGQTADDEGGQFPAVPAPLLLSVPLYKFFVYGFADEIDCLLFEIGGPAFIVFAYFFGYPCLRLGGGKHVAPQLCERVHVEGQVITFVLIPCHGAIYKVIEFGKFIYILPYRFIGGMEYVRAILVNIYTFDALGIDVARYVRAPVDDEHLFARLAEFVRTHSAVEPAANYEIIVHIRLFSPKL